MTVMAIRIRGCVFSGSGEAAYYVKLYENSFEQLLGSKPYPGTLNIRLDKCFEEYARNIKPLVIEPPRSDLGAVHVYMGYLAGYRVLVVKPAKTRYECNVVEVVSDTKLRDILKLKDGDLVEVVILEQ